MSTPEEQLATAKAAHKADPANKDLKKAYKTAKKAAAAWKVEQEAVAAKKAAKKAKKEKKAEPAAVEPVKKTKKDKKRKAEEPEPVTAAPVKKAKKEKKEKTPVTLESLTAAAKSAKAAHKANTADASLKAAYKAARKAVKDFGAAAPAETPTPAETPVEEAAAEETWKEETWKEEKPAPSAVDVPAEASTKLFIGNLSWDIDDDTIRDFFKDCGTLTDIFWLMDKEADRFKGCGFVTFEDLEGASKAVLKKGEYLLGRDIMIEFSKPRPGGEKKAWGAGGGGGGGGGPAKGEKPKTPRPDNCTTVFAGNLSWDIDDDAVREFAKDCGEVKAIRWLTDKNTGEFRGCGFIEFWDSESVDKFVLLNGHELGGRALRLDYSAPRPPREDAW